MPLMVSIGVFAPLILNKLKDKIGSYLINKGKEKLKPKIIKLLKNKLEESLDKKNPPTITKFYEKIKEALEKVDPQAGPDFIHILHESFSDVKKELSEIRDNIKDLKELTEYSFNNLERVFNEQDIRLESAILNTKDEILMEMNKKSDFILKKITDDLISEIGIVMLQLEKLERGINKIQDTMDDHEVKEQARYEMLIEKITNIEMQIKTSITNIKGQTESVKTEYKHTSKQSIKIETSWIQKFDTPRSAEARMKMVRSIINEGEGRINEYVINAMSVVPRHIFSRDDRYDPYAYDKPFPVSRFQTESAPNVIAIMLSLFPLMPGDNILFIGGKGGYIQSVAAEMIGKKGRITVLSKDQDAIRHNKEICEQTPYAEIIDWKLVNDPLDPRAATQSAPYNSIFICGRISQIPKQHLVLLASEKSYLVAPIGGEESQKFCVIDRTDKKYTVNEVKDFGLIFGPPV